MFIFFQKEAASNPCDPESVTQGKRIAGRYKRRQGEGDEWCNQRNVQLTIGTSLRFP